MAEVNIRYFSCTDQFTGTRADFQLTPLELAAGRVKDAVAAGELRLDFCCGLRLEVPGPGYHILIRDAETGRIFYEGVSDRAERLVSLEKYFIPWQVEAEFGGRPVLRHRFNPAGRKVHFNFNAAMGDTLAFLPYLPVYRNIYGGQLSARLEAGLQDFARRCCPWLEFSELVPEDAYAAFYCMFMSKGTYVLAPLDSREIPLWQMGRLIMGLTQARTRLPWPRGPRKIREPYVCIAVQASDVAKTWQYPGGWEEIVGELRELGYRVLCIDRERENSDYGLTARVPEGAEDCTGSRPLVERAELLAHAEFFIGLGSGLAWLANAVGCPVVMIGGFSRPWYEFPEAYRVGNVRLCNGCFNDPELDYKEGVCQRQSHADESFLVCSRLLSPREVWRAITELLQDKVEAEKALREAGRK